jgi:hypothetical protein
MGTQSAITAPVNSAVTTPDIRTTEKRLDVHTMVTAIFPEGMSLELLITKAITVVTTKKAMERDAILTAIDMAIRNAITLIESADTRVGIDIKRGITVTKGVIVTNLTYQGLLESSKPFLMQY